MKIITLAHQKGGVGKTTIAFNVAQAFSGHMKVAIMDIDPQGSTTHLNCKGVDKIPYNSELITLNDLDYDVLFIDTPPYLTDNLSRIFAVSDLVLVPFKPGVLEIASINATVKIIKETQQLVPDLKAYVLFNQVKQHSSLIKEVKDVANEFELPIMKTMICDRVSYVRSFLKGGVFNSKDTKAQKEMVELCKEITTIVND